MRRMLTSRQIEILDSMTEEVFESGVWEIDSGLVDEVFPLKNFEIGYQYKIYLNASLNSLSPEVFIRLETEIGVSQGYFNFFDSGKTLQFLLGNIGGGTNFSLDLIQNASVLEAILTFEGQVSNNVKFRYLITRHKLYI